MSDIDQFWPFMDLLTVVFLHLRFNWKKFPFESHLLFDLICDELKPRLKLEEKKTFLS